MDVKRRFIALIQKENGILKVFLYSSHVKGIAQKCSDFALAVVSPDFSDLRIRDVVGF